MSTTVHAINQHPTKTPYINAQTYRQCYEHSVNDPEGFWAERAKEFLTWFEPWEKVLHGGFDPIDVRWFEGGKLNASYNCLDRHLDKRGDQIAIIWQGDDPSESLTLTYRALYEKVCQLANVLKAKGVQRGDNICIYLPMIPEAAIAMLACARIGAVHSVVFAGFSAEALKTRILDAKCSLVITANEGLRGNKIIPLKNYVDEALLSCPAVKTVIVVKRTAHDVNWVDGRDVWYHEEIKTAQTTCDPEIMDAIDPLFILYTSGSTGTPKGILHGTGGYLLYAAITHKYVFDYHDNEIYWCTADVGWITGHTYGVYGPLANGATTLLFEGIPTYPTPARYWEIIDQYHVNIFYTAPTAIRALRREGDDWVKKTNRQSLRILGNVGEPINPDAWEWYYQVIGDSRCPIVDTWWQTETGGIMITPLPYATPLKPGAASWPFFGVVAEIIDEEGNPAPAGTMGRLVITQPWPGMLQTIYGNQERFVAGYFKESPGHYLTGDQAMKDTEGYYWISGRSDDVIKVSGHRIGTQEVESALVHHAAVAEAAVVAIPDEIKGNSIYAFVTLKADIKGSDELKKELMDEVKKRIGAIAVPAHIQWAQALPKTRSGKIMRRILRKIANHEDAALGDLSTLADPNVIKTLINEED